ncbi:MAG: ankyrin repeat domain-containing protein [Planctomycetaceae bacterium]|nr:ankyrin repeat domain-containing protein [Planctomycetaceae bacterium]
MFRVLCFGIVALVIFPQEPVPSPHQKLIQAIVDNETKTASQLVTTLDVVELNKDDRIHGTPLMAAARAGQDDLVKQLLERGARVDQKAAGGRTALHESAGHGRLSTSSILLQAGANPNAFSEEKTKTGQTLYGLSPLASSIHSGNPEVVNLLIMAGADPFQHSSHHGSCLFRITDDPAQPNRKAAMIQITKRLLELGCDPNEVVGPRTPLINAVWRTDPLAVEVYLEACPGLDVNLVPDGDGLTALHSAVVLPSGHRDHLERVTKIVRLLLKHGADPKKESKNGESALTARKPPEIQQMLQEAIREQRVTK